ncbi:papain fold toxin domain-containing protein [[Phormidium] sp. ETS-05]|uniref:papain fold toxin domain-containing protein n=1 Tax=[Phormidium] sp. ETS-05 TaxID=222819 RepID=UPI0018EF2AB7|nr:papain fold toxin domain-containing protein [[Phormidium] sp. ETS-05]
MLTKCPFCVKRLEAKGVNESITDNGRHYGVEVRGLVFDNLSVEGMKLEDWRQDFSCHSGQFRVTYINLEQDV